MLGTVVGSAFIEMVLLCSQSVKILKIQNDNCYIEECAKLCRSTEEGRPDSA